MKFNIKSRKGFTLIELLVVIGILAVLAAIAIPSVAGLIDRTNVSADNTNANEMTNAMERFVSEYELYKQDIASGTLKDGNSDGVPDNMDAAQGRVYNVTKAVTRADIEKLESKAGFNGIRIDIDSKYAQNHATAKAVMENYMKTSSSTFEPKQSDMTYWYNTVTGYTIVAEKDIDTTELYDKLPTEISRTQNSPASITEWIDLSCSATIPDIKIIRAVSDFHEQVPDGAIYFAIQIPNPKYYGDIDFTKLYWMRTFDTSGKLDLTNNQHYTKVSNLVNSTVQQYIDEQTTPTIEIEIPIAPADYADGKNYVRLAYEYEDNGKIQYVYSAIYCVTWNEINN